MCAGNGDWGDTGFYDETHFRRCRTNCEWADDRTQDTADDEGEMRCPLGHDDHECTCEDIVEAGAEGVW